MLPTRCVFGLKDECEAIIFIESLMSKVEVRAKDVKDDIKSAIQEIVNAYAEVLMDKINKSVEKEIVNMLVQFCSICPHRTKYVGIEAGTHIVSSVPLPR
jgi:TPP-dependent indolepyruvate ferredoxin oxidoreductase alpha subunit